MSKQDIVPEKIDIGKVYIPCTFIKVCCDGVCFIDTPEKAFIFILDEENSVDDEVAMDYKFYLIALTWSQFENLPEFEGGEVNFKTIKKTQCN